MAAALQAMTGNIGILGGCAEGVGKGWHAEAVAYPYDEYANVWYASIKSDRWAHCVLNYPERQARGDRLLAAQRRARRQDPEHQGRSSGRAPTGSTSSPTSTRKSQAIKKLELVVCMDSTITPSGLWADVLLPIATHFERHDVGLPWYKGHYYIHRPKVIEPLGETKTDFQVFTELAYRIEKIDPAVADFGRRYNPKAKRDYFHDNDAADEAYLVDWWKNRVQAHQGVKMSWEEFKKHGVYKFRLDRPLVAFRGADPRRQAVPDARPARSRSCRRRWPTSRTGRGRSTATRFRTFRNGSSPSSRSTTKRRGNSPSTWSPRTRAGAPTRSSTTFPGCAKPTSRRSRSTPAMRRKRGIRTGDIVEVWNERGRVVVPAYVTERCMPGVVVLYEGAWMDLDKDGSDRAGNPDFLTLDEPSPAGAFAYNTILVNFKKTPLEHRPGWDVQATSRSAIFRRDK